MAILPKLHRIFLCKLGLILILGSNYSIAAEKEPAASKTPAANKKILKDHPLVDKIWDVKLQKFIDQATLSARLVKTPYILLGETHDNATHHKYQNWALQQLSAAKRDTVVAFEMINESQGKLIESKKYKG